jgi:hypothetical protein
MRGVRVSKTNYTTGALSSSPLPPRTANATAPIPTENPTYIQCTTWKGERCFLNEQLGLQYRQSTNVNSTTRAPFWIPPKQSWEGPVMYGAQNPYCQDCSVCKYAMRECKVSESVIGLVAETAMGRKETSNQSSSFFHVHVNTTAQDTKTADKNNNNGTNWHALMYGGFLGVEFARDVELQTDQYPTTQENIAFYLDQVWNHPSLLQIWEKPLCIVNTGHHDAAIPGLTTAAFVQNVKWYMHLLSSVCQQFVWIATTVPLGLSNKEGIPFPQGIKKTKEWNIAVHDMLMTDPILAPRLLFIDVYNASLSHEHSDNSMSLAVFCGLMCGCKYTLFLTYCSLVFFDLTVHMQKDWYEGLATVFDFDDVFECANT